MPEMPFAVTAKTIESTLNQLQLLMEDLYEDRIGGAILGDVFEIGSDDVLALNLAASGGLEKASGELSIKVLSTGGIALGSNGVYLLVNSTGGLETDADGAAVKCKPAGGCATDADGLYIVAGSNGYPSTAVASVLASNAIALSGTYQWRWHTLESETGLTDDIDTVTGGNNGEVIMLQAASGHTVTVKKGTGNLSIQRDFVLDSEDDCIILMKTGTNWIEQTRASNG